MKMKLKVKPSAVRKRRYILLEGSKKELERIILEYIGVLGWARAGCVFVELRERNLFKGKIVLSVDRGEVNNVRAAIEVADTNIKVLRISGTLKGLSKSK
jgi:RNase P/RNase MRP subunit POP5